MQTSIKLTRRATTGATALLLTALLAACSGTAASQSPASPSAAPSAVASASPSALAAESPSMEASASPTPTATATPTPAPTPVACTSADLAARVTGWNAGMGQRFGDVQLTNTSQATCIMFAMSRPQLVDGHGAVLINGPAPSGANATISFAPGSILKTEAAASNYCGPSSLVDPVSLAFVLPGTAGRVVATALSATDESGVPPCNGNPGDPGDMSMHAWAP